MQMKNVIIIFGATIVALFLFASCGQNSSKKKELELKEREIALKEKEFELKEKKLSIDSVQKPKQIESIKPEQIENVKPKQIVDLNYLIKYNGKHTWETDIFDIEPLHSRLKNLTGKSYEKFINNIATQPPIEIKEQIFFVSGCYPHSCGSDESAISIDIKNDAIFVAILSSGKLQTFYEKGKIPLPSIFKEYISSYQKEVKIDNEINSKYKTVGTIKSIESQGNNFLDIQILTSTNATVWIWCTGGKTKVYKNSNHAYWSDLKVGMKIGVNLSELSKNEEGKDYLQGEARIDILE